MAWGSWQHRLVTCWAILWFVVISPAHQRGAIQLPMTAWQKTKLQQAVSPVKSCCSQPGVLVEGPAEADAANSRPAPNPKRCAICHINLALTQAPALMLYVPDLGSLEVWVPALVSARLPLAESLRISDARAPPPPSSCVV